MDGVVTRPGEGEVLEGEDRELRVKAVRAELDLLEYDVGSGYDGPAPHYHEHHVDSFYVLEGEAEFMFGDDVFRAGPGSYVAAPVGIAHGFRNAGDGELRLLNVHAPNVGFAQRLRRG